uniref:CWH43-like N-terminal domain-containing protein n=1 Tax=Chrysotila carterae TaxID=13221 RepID=A0A7S4F5D6_CHRCT|mmetsp:Transcript_35239/g.67798  ORF Transcript_35239/g.67798 Transcript_35239/m.67798 type:complete len:299 (-) Transcript_35239:369-1265(-)
MKCLRWLPLIGVGLWGAVLLTIEILVQTRDRYKGGIAMPYISDAGGLKPGYYVFAIGGTIASALLFAQHLFFSPRYISAISSTNSLAASSRCLKGWWYTACALACVAAVALILVTWFDTYDSEDVHFYSAATFFLLTAIALTVFTVCSTAIYFAKPRPLQSNTQPPKTTTPSMATLWPLKLAMTAIFWISVIIYLPIGSVVACESQRLPLDSDYCARNEDFCEDMALPEGDDAGGSCEEPPCTKLWDYSDCPGTTLMSTISQLVSVVMLIGYQATFISENTALFHAEQAMGSRAIVTV